MHCQFKAFIGHTGFALVTAAKDDPFDHRLAVQPAGLSVMQSNDTPLGVPPADTRPYKSIDLTNIIPALDVSRNRRCCPVGTINDGTGCVFPYSSVCPQGTRLEGNSCISEKPPQCPEVLRMMAPIVSGSLLRVRAAPSSTERLVSLKSLPPAMHTLRLKTAHVFMTRRLFVHLASTPRAASVPPTIHLSAPRV